jgi:hypothetical protein
MGSSKRSLPLSIPTVRESRVTGMSFLYTGSIVKRNIGSVKALEKCPLSNLL